VADEVAVQQHKDMTGAELCCLPEALSSRPVQQLTLLGSEYVP